MFLLFPTTKFETLLHFWFKLKHLIIDCINITLIYSSDLLSLHQMLVAITEIYECISMRST